MAETAFARTYGPWAVVTGGTSGIGEALSKELAGRGLNIVLVARRLEVLEEKAEALEEEFEVNVRLIQADLASVEGVGRIISGTRDIEVGLFVPAAGAETNGLFTKNDIDRELKVIQCNVTSTVILSHHFAKGMVERIRGGILLVSSLSGHMPNPYLSTYTGAKAFVLNFGASLHAELKEKGVDVAVLSPGLTKTPMAAGTGIDWSKTPMMHMAPETVAAYALKNLGKKLSIVPGGFNKMMAFMAKYMMPMRFGARINAMMMKRAIPAERL